MPRRRAPWATWAPVSGLAGGRITGDARKGLLHTTEGGGLPNWAAIRSVPHLTVNPATGAAWQHLDFDRSAYALASPGAPNSPNMNAGINIQIEVIGYSRYVADMEASWYRRLAVWMTWLSDEWGIPKSFPFPFGGDEAYGLNGKYRVSWDAFRVASGWVAHQNAPYNSHWDGPFDQKRLLTYMGTETVVAISDKDAQKIAQAVWNLNIGKDDQGKQQPARWWLKSARKFAKQGAGVDAPDEEEA